jgi:hypothetical protein
MLHTAKVHNMHILALDFSVILHRKYYVLTYQIGAKFTFFLKSRGRSYMQDMDVAWRKTHEMDLSGNRT